MHEREDRDDPEGDRKRDATGACRTVRRRDREQLEQRRARARRAEQDRDRADGARVELEDEQREDEPEPADDEVEPPELGRVFRPRRRSGRRSVKAARGDATLPRFPDNAERAMMLQQRWPT
jgi:hypothetical protein